MTRSSGGSPGAVLLMLGLVAAAGLGVDAYVHAHLAGTYAEVTGGFVNEGTLFQAETVLASAAALTVILIRRRFAFALAFIVSASALTLMLVSRYADVGAIGPIPDLYDPVWYPEKIWAAIAEGSAAAVAVAGFALSRRRRALPAEAGSAEPNHGRTPPADKPSR